MFTLVRTVQTQWYGLKRLTQTRKLKDEFNSQGGDVEW